MAIWARFTGRGTRDRDAGDVKGEERDNRSSLSVFALSGRIQPSASPLNNRVWRWLLLIAAGCLAVVAAHRLLGHERSFPALFTGFLALITWAATVRMLLLDAGGKVFWLIWLLVGTSLLFSFPSESAMWVAGAFFSGIFLLFRKYRPYSHLTSRRQMALFLMTVLLGLLLIFGFVSSREPVVRVHVSDAEAASEGQPLPTALTLGNNLLAYGVSSLQMFWFLSLFHLFFRIRLHFMRLRSKLAVSAVLLVLVPVLLIMVMGLLTLYGTLGESRAIRASNILRDWAERAAHDENFVHGLFPDSFTYTLGQGFVTIRGEAPAELESFSEALLGTDFAFAAWDADQAGAYFRIEQDVWLVSKSGTAAPGGTTVSGGKLGEAVMNRLARILHSDIRISFSDTLTVGTGEGEQIRTLSVRSEDRPAGIYGRLRPRDPARQGESAEGSIWQQSLYFGVSSMDLLTYSSGRFEKDIVLIFLEGSLADIAGELAAGHNPLSQMVLMILLILSVMLLVLEMFALLFGVRIASGITSAVRALHRGTRRIAQGDLDTRIEIPNEDELGDLAASFNQMAAAVKRGREEAVLRERLESELETARKIQERLLPHTMPEVPGFEIVGTSLPSQQVGGDYFDFLDMGEGRLGIAIADVSGKGIPAALLMANLQASLHAQLIRMGDVAEVTARINDLLVESTDANMFATFFYGILDRNTSSFTSTNAGHNPPLLLRSGGDLERLETGGLLLGFLSHQSYARQTVFLDPGDVLVLFTDGISEAADTSSGAVSENQFGEERLAGVVRRHASGTARAIQTEILGAVAQHTGNSPQSDDITLVVIKRREGP